MFKNQIPRLQNLTSNPARRTIMLFHSFMIDIADLHAEYGDVSKFINAIRFKHKLYLYKTQIFNEEFKYIINFYKIIEPLHEQLTKNGEQP